MMIRCLFAGAALLLPSLAHAQGDEIVGAQARVWWPQISGRFKGSTDLIGGSRVDLRNDLGLDESKDGVFDVGFWLKVPLLPVRFIFTTYGGQFAATSRLQRTLIIDGNPYVIGTDVVTKIDLRAYTIMLDLGFDFGVDPVTFHFGVQAGAHIFDDRIRVSGLGFQADEKLQGPIPMLGARASVVLFGTVEIFAQLEGISTFGKAGDLDAHYVDATFEVRWWILGHVGLGGGWRVIELFGERNTATDVDSFLMRFDGGFVSVLVRF